MDEHLLAISNDTMDRIAFQLFVLAWMAWTVWNGLKTWRGEEFRMVVEHERTKGPWPSGWGARRRYRSRMGMGYLGVLFGAGFALVSATDLLRMLLGQDEDWGVWWAASYVGMAMICVGGFGVLVYLLVGLPDPLRPPCQRGWEEVKGRLVLVRPGRTPQERAERQPLTVDPAYRPRAEQHRQPPRTP